MKREICMLEINVNKFSEEKKYHVELKIETKGNDIREEIKDNTIRRIYVQSNALKDHEAKSKEKFNYALKEANDAKLAQKEEKDQGLDL